MTQQEAEVKLKVNSKEALDKINKLEQEAEQLRQKFNDCFRKGDTHGIAETAKKLNKVNKEIENMRTNAANINAALKRLDQASPKELRQTIKQINAELNSGRVPRGSKQWKEYCDQLKKVKRELAEVNDELNDHGSLLDRAKNKFNDWGAAAAAGIAAFAGVVLSGKQAVEAYAEMEQEEANVRKFTGMTAEQVADLNEEFKKIDTRTSREELNRLAQEAGRLGKQSKEDVLGFVRAADVINIALDDLGEGATLTLSKLTGIFGDEEKYGTEQALLKVGSVINELSQNCSASAPYLADFSKRLAGVGAQAGMSIQEIMGFAAVLDTQGQAVEMSATAFSQLILKLYKDPAKFAKAAGLDVKQFSDLLKKDANEAVLTLLDALNRAGNIETLAPLFEEMGMDGARASGVLAALAGNIEQVRIQQQEANKAFEEGTSVIKEAEIQNNTAQAQLEKARKGFNEIAVSLGEKLMPVMAKCISGTSMIMRVLNSLLDVLSKYKFTVLALAATIVTYTIALNAAIVKEKILLALEKTIVVVKGSVRIATLALSAAYNLLTGNIQRAAAAYKLLAVTMKTTPIGLAIAAVGALAARLIYLAEKEDEARKAAEESAKAIANYRKELRDVDSSAAEIAKNEKGRLDTLYAAATNENKSRKERQKAAEELQKLYPAYFANLSTEAIMAGNAKSQYDRLADSIMEVARARAAYNKIVKYSEEKVELEAKLKVNKQKQQSLKSEFFEKDKAANDVSIWSYYRRSSVNLRSMRDEARDAYNAAIAEGTDILNQLNEISSAIQDLDKEYSDLIKKHNIGPESDFKNSVGSMPSVNWTKPSAHESKSEKKERERREREAKKAEAAAKKALKERLSKEEAQQKELTALEMKRLNDGEITYAEYIKRKEKIDLDYIERALTTLQKAGLADTETYADFLKQKEQIQKNSFERLNKEQIKALEAEYNTESAINSSRYYSGEQDYLQYLDKQRKLDIAFFDNRLSALKEAGLSETKEYSDLLKGKEELLMKHLKRELRISAENRDAQYQWDVNEANIDFYTPGNTFYQNEQALKQRLLTLELDYYQEMRDLYLVHSDEWEDWNKKIEQRVETDRLEKRRETHELLLQYSKEYRDKDAKARRESEEALVDELYKKGLISEVDYQKAKSEIKKKYENEELERSQKVHSEYTDMVKNLYDAFSSLFENLSKGGVDFWNSLSVAAQASFAIMSAALSQYTAYSNAERDLELAKMEKRYDDEIAAAGTNTKKKEQLEKKKQEETAKIKKKYNDRAMKIELAQAIAQTAQAAIAAYASASAIPVTGWIMAPIAAALATAAGMAQVATIKKQHEAEAIGYYEGGYTGGNNYKKEAGLVHEGEFVANHNAVNNPHLSGLFRLLDYAQRNNTVGSLTAEDVSIALGQGQGVSARGEVTGATAPIVTNSIDTSSLDKLNTILADGIEAVVILDGERGLHNKYQHYQKLINNPRR